MCDPKRATGTLLALAIVSVNLAACGDVRPVFVDGAPVEDAAPDASPDASPDAGIDAPSGSWVVSRLAVVNSDLAEVGPSATGDNLDMYFHRVHTDGAGQVTRLYRASRANEGTIWSAPLPLVSILNVFSPEVSAEGTELYFVSSAGGVLAFVRASRTDPWPDAPMDLQWPAGLGGIALTADGLTAIYTTSGATVRQRTRATIASAWGPEDEVPGIGDSLTYRYASISGDGLALVLSSPLAAIDPHVVIMSRASTAEPFGSPVVPSELQTAPALEACDYFNTADHMYCQRTNGDQGLDVYTVDKAP